LNAITQSHVTTTMMMTMINTQVQCSFVDNVCLSASVSPELQIQFQPFSGHSPAAVARSFFGGVTISCVLPVLSMASYLRTVATSKQRVKAHTQGDSIARSVDLIPRQIQCLFVYSAGPARDVMSVVRWRHHSDRSVAGLP